MNNNNEKYLAEDQYILKEIEDIGPQPTIIEERMRQIGVVQTKAILRNNKIMVDLDKANTRLAKAVGIFSIIQIVIAGLQFILDLSTMANKVMAILIGITFIVTVAIFSKLIKN